MKQRRLNRNELEIGPAPEVMRALQALKAEQLSHYIEGYYNSILIPALAERFTLPPGRVLLCYGLDDFLPVAFAELRRPGATVLVQAMHYANYRELAIQKGLRFTTFAMRVRGHRFEFDIDDCLRKIRTVRPALLMITSPNNPTGNVISPKDFSRIMSATPLATTVFLDQAYIGFQRRYSDTPFLKLLRKYPNLALLRTFSKFDGLAGLRLAYVLCGRDIRTRLRDQPRTLGFSRVHEALGMAALRADDQAQRVDYVRRIRDTFVRDVNRLRHFVAFESETNFVLINCATPGAYRRLFASLAREKVVIVKAYGRRYIRVTVGRSSMVRTLLQIMRAIDRQVH